MKLTIRQGWHYTNKRWLIWLKKLNRYKRLAYSVSLSEDWWYEEKAVSYSGWNKIFGFGAWYHHGNSARLVCQPDYNVKGRLNVAAYVYEQGDWEAYVFSHMYVKSATSMAVEVVDNEEEIGYRFYCGKDSLFVAHINPRYDKKLWPYFGGWDRAYKEVSVLLKRINDIKWK
jgi:hypothetical protein